MSSNSQCCACPSNTSSSDQYLYQYFHSSYEKVAGPLTCKTGPGSEESQCTSLSILTPNGGQRKRFKEVLVCWRWQVPDHLHCCIPRPCQLVVLLAVNVPQGGSIHGSGVCAEEVYHKLGIKVTKLLHYLVDLVKQNCSFAQKVRLHIWRASRVVNFT